MSLTICPRKSYLSRCGWLRARTSACVVLVDAAGGTVRGPLVAGGSVTKADAAGGSVRPKTVKKRKGQRRLTEKEIETLETVI